jgi:methylenetetrahydrofolate dehydrogenase (NADP+)/methenyltetrahydrofolate cyclohydrolase
MILDGKLVAGQIKQQLKEEIAASNKRPPHLVIITVGDDPASKVYVRNKIKACEEVGIEVDHIIFSEEAHESEIIMTIGFLNVDHTIDGIMVQLPLPEGFDERKIIDAVYSGKDVDGLTTTNIGKLRSGQPCFQPCTARGVIDLLDYYGIELDGKNVTIVGRSNIVGKPLADLMMARGATVTQCHSRTKNLPGCTCGADIIVSAIGKPKFIGCKHIGLGQTLIDVGINRDGDGKLCGDIDFDAVTGHCEHITPVPGGVGPMTVAELLRNVVDAWKTNVQEK